MHSRKHSAPLADLSDFKNIRIASDATGIATALATNTAALPLKPNLFVPLSAVAIASEATLWTPTTGKKFRLMGGCVAITGAAAQVTLKDGNGGATILILPLTTLGVPIQFDLVDGILSSTINANLRAVGIALSVISGFLYGIEV